MASTEEIQYSHTQTATDKDQLNQAETAVCSCVGKPHFAYACTITYIAYLSILLHVISVYLIVYSCILEQVIFLSVPGKDEVTDFVLYFK